MTAIHLSEIGNKYTTSNSPFIAVLPTNERIAEIVYNELPAEVIEEATTRFLSTKRRMEWLTTRWLLKKILGKQATINYHTTGRPYIHGIENAPQISISHTNGYVAIALHASPIGIDIQCMQSKLEKIYQRFMNSDEIEHASQYFAMEKAALIWWSAKEAAYKLIDQPGTPLKEGFNVKFVKENQFGESHHNLHIRFYPINNGILTMATQDDCPNECRLFIIDA